VKVTKYTVAFSFQGAGTGTIGESSILYSDTPFCHYLKVIDRKTYACVILKTLDGKSYVEQDSTQGRYSIFIPVDLTKT
jgi:hypothetical protein